MKEEDEEEKEENNPIRNPIVICKPTEFTRLHSAAFTFL